MIAKTEKNQVSHPKVASRAEWLAPRLELLEDGLWGMYQWLDRAPKGRNETGIWWRRHDEYDNG